jgi:hypothetical protein
MTTPSHAHRCSLVCVVCDCDNDDDHMHIHIHMHTYMHHNDTVDVLMLVSALFVSPFVSLHDEGKPKPQTHTH